MTVHQVDAYGYGRSTSLILRGLVDGLDQLSDEEVIMTAPPSTNASRTFGVPMSRPLPESASSVVDALGVHARFKIQSLQGAARGISAVAFAPIRDFPDIPAPIPDRSDESR
jgi:hypothetical protein